MNRRTKKEANHPLWRAFITQLHTEEGQDVNNILQIFWDLACAIDAKRVPVAGRIFEHCPVAKYNRLLRYFFTPRPESGKFWAPFQILSYYLIGMLYYHNRRANFYYEAARRAAADTIFFTGEAMCLNPCVRRRRRAPNFPKTKMQKPRDELFNDSLTRVIPTVDLTADDYRDAQRFGPLIVGELQQQHSLSFMNISDIDREERLQRNLMVELNLSLSPVRNVWEDSNPYIDSMSEDVVGGIGSGEERLLQPPGIGGNVGGPRRRNRPGGRRRPRRRAISGVPECDISLEEAAQDVAQLIHGEGAQPEDVAQPPDVDVVRGDNYDHIPEVLQDPDIYLDPIEVENVPQPPDVDDAIGDDNYDLIQEAMQEVLQDPDIYLDLIEVGPPEESPEHVRQMVEDFFQARASVGPSRDFMNRFAKHFQANFVALREVSLEVDFYEFKSDLEDNEGSYYGADAEAGEGRLGEVEPMEVDEPAADAEEEPMEVDEPAADAEEEPMEVDEPAAQEEPMEVEEPAAAAEVVPMEEGEPAAAAEGEPAPKPKRKYTYRWRGDNPKPRKKRKGRGNQANVPVPDPVDAAALGPDNAPPPPPPDLDAIVLVDNPAPGPIDDLALGPVVPQKDILAQSVPVDYYVSVEQQPPDESIDLLYNESSTTLDEIFDVNNPNLDDLRSKEIIRKYLKERFDHGEVQISFASIALPGKWTRIQAAVLMSTVMDLADMRYVDLETPRPHIALQRNHNSDFIIMERD